MSSGTNKSISFQAMLTSKVSAPKLQLPPCITCVLTVGVFSTLGDILSTVVDIMINVGDIVNTVGGGGIFCRLSTPVLLNTPTVLMISLHVS